MDNGFIISYTQKYAPYKQNITGNNEDHKSRQQKLFFKTGSYDQVVKSDPPHGTVLLVQIPKQTYSRSISWHIFSLCLIKEQKNRCY